MISSRVNLARLARLAFLPFIIVLAGCGGRDAAPPPPATQTPQAEAGRPGAAAPDVAGVRSFVIAPAESKASYHASEEFFPAALAKLGIDAGRAEAVGTTQAMTGRFELDPEHPTAPPGENTFTVRLNT